MRLLLIIILALLGFISCSLGLGSSTDKKPPPFGWRTTGLNPDPQERSQWGTGLLQVKHVGNRLFVMNAKVKDPNNTYVKDYQIFTAMQGDTLWDTLRVPGGLSPYSIYADSQYLYVGTDTTAQIFRYEPESKSWTDLNVMQEHHYRVVSISQFKDNLVASLASNLDTMDKPIMLQIENESWIDLQHYVDIQLVFHTSVSYNEKFYIATYSKGVWFWNPSDSSWSHVPDVRDSYISLTHVFPRSLAVHKNQLYVGYWNGGGIHRLDGGQWVQVDSLIWIDHQWNSRVPLEVYSLISNGDYLFAAGRMSSIPTAYMGDHGESKGWRQISRTSYCPPGRYSCLGTEIYGMDILNDTLYAAAWEGLIKFPLNDLDSGIAESSAYPRPEVSSSSSGQ